MFSETKRPVSDVMTSDVRRNELSDWWKIYPLSSKFVRWVSLNMAPSSIGTVRRRNFKSAKWHFGLHQKKN